MNFHVITFEQPSYHITKKERARIKNKLKENNISWYPRPYHSGNFHLFKKAYDLLQTFFLIFKLRFFKQAKTILAFANIAAAYSYLFKKALGLKMIVFSYEPHSEFLAELNIWERTSLKYKLLNTLEWKAGLSSEIILTGTKFMVERLQKMGAKGALYRAPTGIDPQAFYPTSTSSSLRSELGLTNKKILFYIGKFGDLYYDEEIAELFKTLRSHIENLYFFVVTPSPMEVVRSYFKNLEINPESYHITPSTLSTEEVNLHIGMADICLSTVPPSPSQKYRSPTKVGEYLLCGKPFITIEGVSEDDIYAREHKVGVVLEDFSERSIIMAIPEITTLLEEDRIEQSERCRNVGLDYRSKENVTKILGSVFDDI